MEMVLYLTASLDYSGKGHRRKKQDKFQKILTLSKVRKWSNK